MQIEGTLQRARYPIGAILLALIMVDGLSIAWTLLSGRASPIPVPVTVTFTDEAQLLLALGTLTLAYAAALQAFAANRQAQLAEVQAQTTEAQLDTAKEQLRLSKDQLKFTEQQASSMLAVAKQSLAQTELAMNQAKAADNLRRASSFPRLRIVIPPYSPSSRPRLHVPGERCVVGGSPVLGIENSGRGPAHEVRVSASWKTFGFFEAEAATPGAILDIPWRKVPSRVPLIDRIEPEDAEWIETVPWTSALSDGSRMKERIVALWIRVTYTDPDGARASGPEGGLSLVAGSYRPDAVTGIKAAEFVMLGRQDRPPEAAFSDEPPVVV